MSCLAVCRVAPLEQNKKMMKDDDDDDDDNNNNDVFRCGCSSDFDADGN